MGFGNGSAESLVALARSTRADVLSVQELTPELVRRLDAAGLGELMPHYVLADERIGVRAVSVHSIPGTDHRAVFAVLRLPSEGR